MLCEAHRHDGAREGGSELVKYWVSLTQLLRELDLDLNQVCSASPE